MISQRESPVCPHPRIAQWKPRPGAVAHGGIYLLLESSWFPLRCCVVAGKEEAHSFLPADSEEAWSWGLLLEEEKNSMVKFGPWSELCVYPLLAGGDDICSIMTVLDGIVVYWEKSMFCAYWASIISSYSAPIVSSGGYQYIKKKSRSKLLCISLRAVGGTLMFPETLWLSDKKLAHIRMLW